MLYKSKNVHGGALFCHQPSEGGPRMGWRLSGSRLAGWRLSGWRLVRDRKSARDLTSRALAVKGAVGLPVAREG